MVPACTGLLKVAETGLDSKTPAAFAAGLVLVKVGGVASTIALL